VDMQNGKVGVYRGNNGGDHNRNSIGGAYLTGRYGCKNCKCKSWDNCEQFTKPVIGSTHNLRLELSTTDNDRTHVKAYLNGTLVIDVVDEEHRRYKRWMGTAPSEDTNMCGDFGLATYDSDVVSYKIKDYTGYVAAPTTIPVDVEMTVAGETEESFTQDKQTTLIESIAAQLGIDASLISIKIGRKSNPIARRLSGSELLITVTIAMEVEKVTEEVEKLESPAFKEAVATATGITTTFQAFKPAKTESGVTPLCARCKWDGTRIHVEHFINAQKHGEKGLQHKCYHADGKCTCKCKATPFEAGGVVSHHGHIGHNNLKKNGKIVSTPHQ